MQKIENHVSYVGGAAISLFPSPCCMGSRDYVDPRWGFIGGHRFLKHLSDEKLKHLPKSWRANLWKSCFCDIILGLLVADVKTLPIMSCLWKFMNLNKYNMIATSGESNKWVPIICCYNRAVWWPGPFCSESTKHENMCCGCRTGGPRAQGSTAIITYEIE